MALPDEDDWDYVREERRLRRPSPPRRYVTDTRRSSHQRLLNPHMMDGGSLARTRSQGAHPNPIIINNELVQDNRTPSPYSPYPPSPDMRGRNRLGSDLADEFLELALGNRRVRSRSRGVSDAAWADRRDDWYEAELRRKERQLAQLERKASLEDDRERMRREFELLTMKEKEERKRIEHEYELKKKEEEEERKDEEQRIREKIKREEREKKEKEDKEWDEFMDKWKAKEAKKKEEEKKKQDEMDEAFRLRLLNMGYSRTYIERMMAEEKLKRSDHHALVPFGGAGRIGGSGRVGAPTYVKIHREYLSIDTLRYFNLPWEWDKKDKNYIIILREMDKSETELLFEHTRSLRQGKLLLEPAPKRATGPQYAFVRKRDRSSSQVKKLSIVKFDEDK